ncbi:MAG: uracil-DNA glycosylase [Phycisphaerae bacterium]
MPTTAQKELLRLSARIRRCVKCRLHCGRMHAVPGEGPCEARIMLVGEAPGAAEDRTGRPFVGQAGRFLDKLLTAVRMSRKDFFITSAVKCRPPHNRPPRADELATCKATWLLRQIELVNPRLIVALGAVALRQLVGKSALLGKSARVGNPVRLDDLHGRLFSLDSRRVLATYHPAAAMRFPKLRAKFVSDFDRIAPAILAVLPKPVKAG